jgi:hypothetical protein
MPLTSGTKIGPYEIGSLLGVGGMGEVYRSRQVEHTDRGDQLTCIWVSRNVSSLQATNSSPLSFGEESTC